jgi:hypothetical protein
MTSKDASTTIDTPHNSRTHQARKNGRASTAVGTPQMTTRDALAAPRFPAIRCNTRPFRKLQCRYRRIVRSRVLVVAALIHPGTYSSRETLAYHPHTRGRVRLFEQRTPGAADHVTPVRVTPSVVALIPETTPMDVVSGTN